MRRRVGMKMWGADADGDDEKLFYDPSGNCIFKWCVSYSQVALFPRVWEISKAMKKVILTVTSIYLIRKKF